MVSLDFVDDVGVSSREFIVVFSFLYFVMIL